MANMKEFKDHALGLALTYVKVGEEKHEVLDDKQDERSYDTDDSVELQNFSEKSDQ